MGMFTEIYINVNLKTNTPPEVLNILKKMCSPVELSLKEWDSEYPDTWLYLFKSGSYYTPNTYCRFFEYDKINECYSLLGKGDIKNYGEEIQQFFDWILPWVDGESGDFVGYHRYENNQQPTLVFLPDEDEDDGDE
jgi:hypothetical protein